MNSQIKGSIPHICLTAMFLIGNTVINLPFADGVNSSIPGFTAAAVIGIPYFLLCAWIIKRCGSRSLPEALCAEHRAAGGAVALLFALYALFCGLACLRNYITFSSLIILPEMSAFFPSLIFLALTLWLCRLRPDVLLKTALIGAAFVLAAVAVLFLAGLPTLQADNLLPVKWTSKSLLYQCGSYLAMSLLEGLILTGFFAGMQKSGARIYLGGLTFGGAILLLCLVQSIAVFGYRLVATMRFPYANSMSIVSFGDKFSRMEGFSYLVYFGCCLIKSSVCVRVARDFICAVWPGSRRFVLPAVGAVFLIVCLFPSVFKDLSFNAVALWFILPAAVLPVLLLCLLPKRSGKA